MNGNVNVEASRIKKVNESSNTAARAKSNNKFLNFDQRQGYDFEALEKKLLGN